MDPKATGGFSSEATRPSGRVSYYQPVQPRQAFVPSTEIVRAPSANPDALSASSTYPYYELYGTLPAPPSPLPVAPDPNPVSDFFFTPPSNPFRLFNTPAISCRCSGWLSIC